MVTDECNYKKGVCWYKDEAKYGDNYLYAKEKEDGSRDIYVTTNKIAQGEYTFKYIGTISKQDSIDLSNNNKSIDLDEAFNNKELHLTGGNQEQALQSSEESKEFQITAEGVLIGTGVLILTGTAIVVFFPESVAATTIVGAGRLITSVATKLLGKTPKPPVNSGSKGIDTIAGIIPSFIDLINQAQSTEKEVIIDPITFDLDGDGLETTSLENGIYFDQNNDGFMETTAWVAKDDGLLALDRNLNGSIDNGNELFGDNTKLSDGSTASDGYEALAELDTNSDGKIDINDSEFSNLKIMKGDGTTMTMDEAGIKSIDLNHSETEITDDNGNEQTAIRKLARCA